MRRAVLAVVVVGLLAAPGRAQDKDALKWRDPAPVLVEGLPAPDGVKARLGRLRRPVEALAFSHDGKLVAVWQNSVPAVGQPCPLHIVEVATGKVRHTLPGHKVAIFCAAFSPDGSVLATGGMDNVLCFWDVKTGKQIGEPLPHSNHVNSLHFTPDGKRLITADNELRIWDVAGQKEVGRFTPPKLKQTEYFTGALSHDGKVFAARSAERIRWWDVKTAKLLHEITLKTSYGGHAPVFSADDKYLIDNVDPDGLQMWDVASGQPQLAPQKNAQGLGEPTYVFSPAGRLRAWRRGQKNGAYNEPTTYHVLVADIKSGELVAKLSATSEPAALLFGQNGELLAWGGKDGSLRLFDITTGEVARSLFDAVSPVTALVFTAEGQKLRALTLDQELHDWFPQEAKELRRAASKIPLWTLYRLIGSGKVLDVTDDGLGLWDAATGKLVATFKHKVAQRSNAEWFLVAGFSPDGSRLALLTDENANGANITVVDTSTGKPLAVYPTEAVGSNAVAVASDGRMIAFGRYEGQRGSEVLVVLETATGKVRRELTRKFAKGERTWLRALHLAPDGKHVLAVRMQDLTPMGREPPPPGPRTAVEVWDLATGKLVETLPANGPAVAFSPDGSKFAFDAAFATGVYDLKAHKLGKGPVGHWDGVRALAFSPDGATLATGGDDGAILLWDVAELFKQ
jgi:WD40 repeat protein